MQDSSKKILIFQSGRNSDLTGKNPFLRTRSCPKSKKITIRISVSST
ncbi:hypothetical protein LEP1GSC173_2877 [Leptospira interrogans str. HAI1594]|uniref:Uncharacterized protein n=5 Tax=Leptospira interrogans TaxID=173 RepID=A0A0E2D635_LEPIR|nr:hypothetical protein LEP1GSC009_3725 [Leptospira interrogans serovar Grippotyphosa str. Andaman]EKO96516.1 hypothetical protein LEP1GSC057_4053 [Leptospira interrogans str. Brem 329]EKP24532.1 hypothetical protein LEP1GSC117_1746 [Leptospira interrogans serovar Icterohaemorrhagiae str. Verdun LP]EKP75342.1 hypothetical protein LEP1GSC173_2877 [Leptospira interrogans str. HAI1594]EKP84669.1 hypothetical protein LEP1GSC020_4779 [Leptospira interrogans serovar Grippotyphosa str. 2006006986]EKR